MDSALEISSGFRIDDCAGLSICSAHAEEYRPRHSHLKQVMSGARQPRT